MRGEATINRRDLHRDVRLTMGIYDRDWYKEPNSGSGWFGSLHPVAKIMLVLLVGCIVVAFLTKSWGSKRHRAMDDLDEFEREVMTRRTGGIHDAAERGDVGRVAQILARDATQVNAVLRKDRPDQPLHRAAWAG